MTAQPKPYVSEEAYLEAERSSTSKHEYFKGRIYAMTGAKESHNLIAANTLASLHSQLRQKPCRVYPSDMRIKVLRTGLNTYPDVVVICGQPRFTDDVRDTIVNPTVIVEVLSASTERYDRGMKFQNYHTVDTLQDYVSSARSTITLSTIPGKRVASGCSKKWTVLKRRYRYNLLSVYYFLKMSTKK